MRWISDKAQSYFLKQYRLQRAERWSRSLLDSSLIIQTLPRFYYNCKLYQCGNYLQIFTTTKNNLKQSEKKEQLKAERRGEVQKIINSIPLTKKEPKKAKLRQIEEKNIIRSKNEMCRLILANEKVFKTFITLTFNSDVTELDHANKELNKFFTKIRRVYKDFKYLCVPEFTKKNRIHYHMITNIDYNNVSLINENISLNSLYNKIDNKSIKLHSLSVIKSNINNKMNDFKICLRYDNENKLHNTKLTFNFKSRKKTIFKTIKYWNEGFTNVLKISDVCGNNIVGYLSKYMTKDIDDKLFGFRKYTYSRNLEKVQTLYFNLDNKIDELMLDVNYLSKIKNIRYENNYTNRFGDNINFIEVNIIERL